MRYFVLSESPVGCLLCNAVRNSLRLFQILLLFGSQAKARKGAEGKRMRVAGVEGAVEYLIARMSVENRGYLETAEG